MKQIIFLSLCFVLMGLSACSNYAKPPLEPTQVVDGKSIIMPPEFYVLPKAKQSTQDTNTSTNND